MCKHCVSGTILLCHNFSKLYNFSHLLLPGGQRSKRHFNIRIENVEKNISSVAEHNTWPQNVSEFCQTKKKQNSSNLLLLPVPQLGHKLFCYSLSSCTVLSTGTKLFMSTSHCGISPKPGCRLSFQPASKEKQPSRVRCCRSFSCSKRTKFRENFETKFI